jgi:hypothetical protein
MIRRFRKKPVVIEAVQWTGRNGAEVQGFLGDDFLAASDDRIEVRTLEGPITASVGDVLIRGVNGEHYPCKPDVFEKTYEEV